MIVFPNAKINIGLNVVSRRSDGYHNLETVFYPVQVSDVLEMVESGNTGLTISGNLIEGNNKDNLILKAYHILEAEYNLPPVQFHLHKIIPTGAGLGGGSSDAAHTLTMLNNYFELQINGGKLKEYATQIGADCPFFIDNKVSFATGIGNELSTLALDLSKFSVLIVKPSFSVSTPEAYKNITPSKPNFNLSEIGKLPIEDWKENIFNDFEKSVFPQFPEIKSIKESLYKMGALYSSMSGSGSSVFGIFRHLPANPDKYLPKGVLIYR